METPWDWTRLPEPIAETRSRFAGFLPSGVQGLPYLREEHAEDVDSDPPFGN